MTPKQQQALIHRLSKARRKHAVIEPARHASSPFTAYPVTLRWGFPGRLWAAGHHTGEDHACPVGSLATAVSWGHVIATGWSALGWGQDYGNMVIVELGTRRHVMAYCHLSKILVKPGQHVQPGLVVGLTGETGHVTGPHLHFEVRPPGGRYGSDQNPMLVKRM